MKKATGNVIRRHRERIDLDQHEVGFLVYGIPPNRKNAAQQRVAKVEKGIQALRVTDLAKYADLYKINPCTLFEEILKEYNKL